MSSLSKLYMVEMIRERQHAEKVQCHDLFSSLLAANANHTLDVTTLLEDKLIGLWATNISIPLIYKMMLQVIFTSSSLLVMRFEFASLSWNKALWHLLFIQTTAHTLCFSFAMLALYPEEQEKLFGYIKSIIPDGQKPVRTNPLILQEASNADTDTDIWTDALTNIFFGCLLWNPPNVPTGQYLSYPRGSLYMFNILSGHLPDPKNSCWGYNFTSFITTNIHSEKCIIPIPKDTNITISVPGLYYNRKAAYLPYHVIIFLYQTLAHYWEDPHAFKPSHFLEDWPHDAFLPFSSGKPFYKIGWYQGLTNGTPGAHACIGRKSINHNNNIRSILTRTLEVFWNGGNSYPHHVIFSIQT